MSETDSKHHEWDIRKKHKANPQSNGVFGLLLDREAGFPKTSPRRTHFVGECSQDANFVQRLEKSDGCYGHGGCVNTVNWDESGDYLISGSDDTIVKVWDYRKRKVNREGVPNGVACVANLHGHRSNVFSAFFLPGRTKYNANSIALSGGNDADCRVFDIETETCLSHYCHFSRKVLCLAVSIHLPHSFLACSSDGTVRLFDIRQDEGRVNQDQSAILPQAFGGGPAGERRKHSKSLLVDYTHFARVPQAVFSVDIHPIHSNIFICGAADGEVRMFDIRYITEKNPDACIKSFRNEQLRFPNNHDPTSCSFSQDGTEILTSNLNDCMYLFDSEIHSDIGQRATSSAWGEWSGHPDDLVEKQEAMDVTSSANSGATSADIEDSDVAYHSKMGERLTELQSAHSASFEIDGVSLSELFEVKSESDANSSTEPQRGTSSQDDTPTPSIESDDQNDSGPVEQRDQDSDSEDSEDIEDSYDTEVRASREFEVFAAFNDAIRHLANARRAQNQSNRFVDATNPKAYRQQYKGHVHCNTIKGAGFFGPNFVMTGSDDNNIYIYHKQSGQCHRILKGGGDIVNQVVGHPHMPVLATCGIDDHIQIWDPTISQSKVQKKLKQKFKERRDVIRDNTNSLLFRGLSFYA